VAMVGLRLGLGVGGTELGVPRVWVHGTKDDRF